MTNTATIHAALTSNRFFKAFVGADGQKPKPEHLVATLKTLVMAFDEHWIGIPDGGSYPRNGELKDTQKAVSAVAHSSMEADSLICLDHWEEFMHQEDDKWAPTHALNAELHKVCLNNYRDSRTNNHLEHMYVPGWNEESIVDEAFNPLIGEQLGLAANKFFTFIPSSLKGNSEDAMFHNKLTFESDDVRKLGNISLEELPGAADAEDIDHPEGIDANDLFNMRTGVSGKETIVHLDSVELVIADHYRERFQAWLSHSTNDDVLELAAARVVSAAEYGREMAKERSAKTFEAMFGNVA